MEKDQPHDRRKFDIVFVASALRMNERKPRNQERSHRQRIANSPSFSIRTFLGRSKYDPLFVAQPPDVAQPIAAIAPGVHVVFVVRLFRFPLRH
jgi:hypothetical protein